MDETSRFDNVFHRASRLRKAARFVFEQNGLLFSFEVNILLFKSGSYRDKKDVTTHEHYSTFIF